jgi:CHAD domain-containing protein
VVLAQLRRYADQVQTQERRVRLDLPDSVHQMRVATRRFRGVVTTFRPLFEQQVIKPLRNELAWLAAELGTARDAEVLRESVRTAVASESRQLASTAVADVIMSELAEICRCAHDRVLDDLDTDRYRSLLAELETFVQHPPLRKRAAAPAGQVLPPLVARSYDRVSRSVEAAHDRESGPDRDELLHDARKAAKRARYAGEAIAPVFGSEAITFAAAMEDVQSALGEHNDSVLTRERLHDLALHASSTEAAFVYGRLHAREEARASLAERHFDTAWKAAGRRSLHRWLQ